MWCGVMCAAVKLQHQSLGELQLSFVFTLASVNCKSIFRMQLKSCMYWPSMCTKHLCVSCIIHVKQQFLLSVQRLSIKIKWSMWWCPCGIIMMRRGMKLMYSCCPQCVLFLDSPASLPTRSYLILFLALRLFEWITNKQLFVYQSEGIHQRMIEPKCICVAGGIFLLCLLVASQCDLLVTLQSQEQETHSFSVYSKPLLESGSEPPDDPDRPSLTSAFNPWRR